MEAETVQPVQGKDHHPSIWLAPPQTDFQKTPHQKEYNLHQDILKVHFKAFVDLRMPPQAAEEKKVCTKNQAWLGHTVSISQGCQTLTFERTPAN